jgi:hypothetical protein
MFAKSVSVFYILCTLVYAEISFDESLMITKVSAMRIASY